MIISLFGAGDLSIASDVCVFRSMEWKKRDLDGSQLPSFEKQGTMTPGVAYV